MGKKVYANGMEIAHKAGGAKVIAAFPDVCLSPPGPPAGPLPVPYPNSSFARDLQKGSKSVAIGGAPLALKGQSYYRSAPLGDEAATRSFGGSVITHTIAGKTYFQAHSMDVRVDGKNVCRHLDITTSNHDGQTGSTPPMPNVESMSPPSSGDETEKCPCCDGNRHPNQKDASGAPLKETRAGEYYAGKRAAIQAKVAGFDAWAKKNPDRLGETWPLKFAASILGPFEGTPPQVAAEEVRRALQLESELATLTAGNPDCANVRDDDSGCAKHYEGAPPGSAAEARKEFTKAVRKRAHERAAQRLRRPVADDLPVHHVTPLDAGGCPKGDKNVLSDAELSGPCKRIDDLQTALQGRTQR